MRGGRGSYTPRGAGSGRGTSYRSSHPYGGNRIQSGARGGRYGESHFSGGQNRYNNYNTGNHYDSRNRDKFNTSGGGGRYDSHKRRDNSRDRSDDRKRVRNDDYRRPSDARGNRTPPPPPPPMTSSSTSNYRGNTAGGSYRGSHRGDRDDSNRRHSPIKRPIRTSGYISKLRGTIHSSSRGLRTSIRGGGRIMHRESNEVRIMRRKLLYAQQKDRARVLKIAHLKSSLRRHNITGSKSPSRSNSGKSDENDDDDDDEEKKGETEGKKKAPSKRSSSSKRRKSSDKAEEDVGENSDNANNDDDNEEEGDENVNLKTESSTSLKSKKSEGEIDANSLAEADIKVEKDAKTAEEEKENKDTAKEIAKKAGKRRDKEGKDEVEVKKEKATPKKPKKSENDEKSKREDHTDDESDKKDRRRSSRHISQLDSSPRKGHFIKLTCIHCRIKCVTFKEYSNHLYTRTHKIAIRQIALRQKAHLLRLRARQRTAQREIEEKSSEEYESKFCHLCRLHYRQPKAKHQLSEHHKTMKKFLMPYCSTCHLAFKSPMLYETHRCSLEHIRNKARKRDSDSDNSGNEVDDEMREIDLNKFLTVDSVGEIDDEDIGVDALLQDSEIGQDGEEEEGKERQPVGAKFIKQVDAFYCEICKHFGEVNGITLEAYAKKHCLQRTHLKAFLRHKGEEEKKAAKQEAELKIKEKAAEEEKEFVDKSSEAKEAEEETVATANDATKEAEAEDEEHVDDKLWEDVDKDLGDLLREVVPAEEDDDDEEEDESVLNIDIESEKPKPKEINGKKEDDSKEEPKKEEPKPVSAKAPQTTPAKTVTAITKTAATTAKLQATSAKPSPSNKPKLQRKASATAAGKSATEKSKSTATPQK